MFDNRSLVMLNCAVFVGASVVGRLAERGLANTLGLATLRHGTNAVSWLSIHLFGTIPFFGGNCTGGDYAMQYRQNAGRIYFSYAHATDSEARGTYGTEKLDPDSITATTPKEYEFKSNLHLFNTVRVIPYIISIPVSLFLTVLIPSVKVHLPDESVKDSPHFSRDRSEYYSYSTDQWISPLNMGVVGSVWQSLTHKTPGRMINNPSRVLTGVVQLALCGVAAGFIAMKHPDFVAAHSISLIAGLALGMI